MCFKIRLTVFSCLIVSASFAQVSFEQITGPPPESQFIHKFERFSEGDAQFGDLNGDGAIDLIMTGLDYNFNPSTYLYLSDGTGRFTLSTTNSFPGLAYASLALSNVDGDSDLDIFMSGYDFSFSPVTKLFVNDGNGNFTESVTSTFIGLGNSNMALADVDGDLDNDLIIIGEDISGIANTALYLNNGVGVFSQDLSAPFDSVTAGDVKIFAFDENADQYVVLSGTNPKNVKTTRLYKNDGFGAFTEVLSVAFDGLSEASVAVGDVDDDLDIDLIFAGQNAANEFVTKLYLNDGIDDFELDITSNFIGVNNGMIELVDLDADNDLDLFVTGNSAGFQRIATYYENDGVGEFAENNSTQFNKVSLSAITTADIEGDGDIDLVLIGENEAGAHSSSLYQNNGVGEFVLSTSTPFDGVYSGAIVSADVDGDLDEDVLIAGTNGNGESITSLYLNNGFGGYSFDSSGIAVFGFGQAEFADVDGDLDYDLIINGADVNDDAKTTLYINDGFGGFDSVPTIFENLKSSTVEFGDVDGDNDLDVLLTGRNNDLAERISKLYLNDSLGNFTEVAGTPFLPVYQSKTVMGDIDGDEDLDIIISGSNSFFPPVATINMYINDGSGNYSNAGSIPFDPQTSGQLKLVDLDGDLDLDFIQIGSRGDRDYHSNVFINDGFGDFSPLTVPFVPLTAGDIGVSDFNEDGFLDVIITGYDSLDRANTKLYLTNGALNYVEHNSFEVDQLWASSIRVLDIDNDQDDDIIISGYDDFDEPQARIFRNTSCFLSSGSINVKTCFEYISPSGEKWTSSGTYLDTLVGANSKGCDSVVTVDLIIDTVDVTVSVFGSEITAEATAAAFQWLDCDAGFAEISGETGNVYAATGNGNFAVEVFQNGCVDTSLCEVINIVGATEGIQLETNFYPNPVLDDLTISNPFVQQGIFSIRNAEGVVLFTKTLAINESVLIPWSYGEGFFTVSFESGTNFQVAKLVKY